MMLPLHPVGIDLSCRMDWSTQTDSFIPISFIYKMTIHPKAYKQNLVFPIQNIFIYLADGFVLQFFIAKSAYSFSNILPLYE